jgi:hypothetical protein
MKPGAIPPLPSSVTSQCPAQTEALVAEVLLYSLADGNRILLLCVASHWRNYENCETMKTAFEFITSPLYLSTPIKLLCLSRGRKCSLKTVMHKSRPRVWLFCTEMYIVYSYEARSLDLDFNFIVSNLAPVGLLIRPAGRSWRRMDRERPVAGPKVVIYRAEPAQDVRKRLAIADPAKGGHGKSPAGRVRRSSPARNAVPTGRVPPPPSCRRGNRTAAGKYRQALFG